VEPLIIPTVGHQPFSSGVSTWEDVEEAVETLFDPYRWTLPEGQEYEGSVYQALDEALAQAYATCGYDLAAIAASGQGNPMTQEDFRRCLPNEEYYDPVTGATMRANDLDWLQRRVGAAAARTAFGPFLERLGLDRCNPMNFEPNYLRALSEAHPEVLEEIQQGLLSELDSLFAGDPMGALEYLETFGSPPVGTQ